MLRRSLLVALLGLFLHGCAVYDYDDDHDGHRYYSHHDDVEYRHRSYDNTYWYRHHDDRRHGDRHYHGDWRAERKAAPHYNGRWEDRHERRYEGRKAPAHKDERRGGYSRIVESKRKQHPERDRHSDWDRHRSSDHDRSREWHDRRDRDDWSD